MFKTIILNNCPNLPEKCLRGRPQYSARWNLWKLWSFDSLFMEEPQKYKEEVSFSVFAEFNKPLIINSQMITNSTVRQYLPQVTWPCEKDVRVAYLFTQISIQITEELKRTIRSIYHCTKSEVFHWGFLQ